MDKFVNENKKVVIGTTVVFFILVIMLVGTIVQLNNAQAKVNTVNHILSNGELNDYSKIENIANTTLEVNDNGYDTAELQGGAN